MSKSSVFLLLILALGLGGYVAWDLWSQQKVAQQQEELSKIWKGETSSVQKVSIQTPQTKIVLERTESGWAVNGKLADRKSVEEFIEGIAVEKQDSVVVEGENIDFKEFGLSPEAGTLEIQSQEAPVKLKIGNRKNIEGKNYLQIEGEKKVRLVAGTWIPKLEKKEFDFRDKRLFMGDLKAVIGLEFRKGKEKIDFNLQDGVWTAAQAPNWKLDQNKVREILTQLQSNAVSEFLSEGTLTPAQKQMFQWDKPVFELKVMGADFQVRAMKSKENIHAWLLLPASVLVRVSPDFTRNFLFETLADFRDKRLPLPEQRDQILTAEFKWGSAVQSPSSAKIAEILRKLSSLQAQQVSEGQLALVQGELQLLSSAGLVWRMKVGSQEKSGKLTSEKDTWWVSVDGTSDLFLITQEDLKSLGFEIPEKQSEKK
ncbi:MAG: DUF4340 domain-containing protein [Proteobacteria bacterium]|jgi:hypothetical protein|nr:DUF4340 domain-containing protein [Pseudomonadota bacterium]